MAKKKLINTGYVDSRFFDKSDFNLEIEIGRDYLKQDIPASVMFYKVDYKKTKTHALYGESRASEKVVLPPIQLQVRFTVEDSEGGYLQGGEVSRHFAGDLIFTIYEDEIREKNVDIQRGDYIGIKNGKGNTQYYEIYDADIMNVANNRTIGGLESYYKKIKCTVVDKDVFNG